MSRRKIWSKAEKLAILDHCDKHGVTSAKREYGVSFTTIYKWRNKFEQQGTEGLESKRKKHRDAELARLERENRALKAIVAEKELQLRIQAEMLKKSQ